MPTIETGGGGQFDWQVRTDETQETLQTQQGVSSRDQSSIAQLAGGQQLIISYDSKYPNLLPPNIDLSNPNNPNGNPDSYATKLPPDLQYVLGFETNLAAYAQNTKPPPSAEEINQIRYSFYNPDANVGEATSKLATELSATTLKDIQTEYPEFKPTVDTKQFQQDISTEYDESFEKYITQPQQKNGLTDEQVAQMRFAHYHPDAGAKLPDNLNALLQKTQETALNEIKGNYGVPGDKTVSPSAARFDDAVQADYNFAFESALDQYAADNKLSDQEVMQLKYMHYHPDANYADAAKLKGIVSQLQGEALGQIKGQYGLPKGWKPEINTKAFDGVIQGKFWYGELKNDPAAFIEKMGLPSNWTVPTGPPSGGLLDPESAQILHTAIDASFEQLETMTSYLNTLPDSPDKFMMLDYLKNISEQLTKLKEFLYALQASDSIKSKEAIVGKIEAQKNKIEEQFKQMEEMREKQAKAEGTKIGMAILAAVLAVLAIVTGGATAGLIGIVIVAYMAIDSIVAEARGEKTSLGLLFEAIEKAPNMPQWLKSCIKVAVMIVIIVLGAVSGAGMVAVGAVCTAFAESGLIKDMAIASGSSKEEAELINMVICAVITIVASIASMKLGGVTKLGGKVQKTTGGFGKYGLQPDKWTKESIGNVRRIQRPLMKFANQLHKLHSIKHFTKVMRGLQITELTLGVIQGGVGTAHGINAAEMAKSKGKHEAMMEEIQALIKMFQKLIDSMMNGMSAAAEDIVATEENLEGMWGGAGQEISALTDVAA